MNGTYYKNPTFPVIDDNNIDRIDNDIDINTIIKNNIGKKVIVHMNYKDHSVFDGIIECINDEIMIVSNYENNTSYLLLFSYLEYIEFKEKISL